MAVSFQNLIVVAIPRLGSPHTTDGVIFVFCDLNTQFYR